jgi:hypothetical protein
MRGLVDSARSKSQLLRPSLADNKSKSMGCFFMPMLAFCGVVVLISLLSGGSLIALPSRTADRTSKVATSPMRTGDVDKYFVNFSTVLGGQWYVDELNNNSAYSTLAPNYPSTEKASRITRNILDEDSYIQQEIVFFDTTEAASRYFSDPKLWSLNPEATVGSFIGSDVEKFVPQLKSVGKHYIACENGESSLDAYVMCTALFLCNQRTVWLKIQIIEQFRLDAAGQEVNQALAAVDRRCTETN